MLCNDLEGWDREDRREVQEGGYMGIYAYIWLIHFVVQRKVAQHCEAIILNKDVKKNNKIDSIKKKYSTVCVNVSDTVII